MSDIFKREQLHSQALVHLSAGMMCVLQHLVSAMVKTCGVKVQPFNLSKPSHILENKNRMGGITEIEGANSC